MLKNKSILIDILSKSLVSDDILLFYGDVGAGKTTFITELCETMGVDSVTSPTYTITNHYTQGDIHIIHSDLYRLKAIDYDVLSQIYSQDAICMIEWADRLDADYMRYFKNFMQLFLEKDNDIVRVIPHGRFVNLMLKKADAA